jgi:hypothetical protein
MSAATEVAGEGVEERNGESPAPTRRIWNTRRRQVAQAMLAEIGGRPDRRLAVACDQD